MPSFSPGVLFLAPHFLQDTKKESWQMTPLHYPFGPILQQRSENLLDFALKRDSM